MFPDRRYSEYIINFLKLHFFFFLIIKRVKNISSALLSYISENRVYNVYLCMYNKFVVS